MPQLTHVFCLLTTFMSFIFASPVQAFDAARYLCEEVPSKLSSYQDVMALDRYLTDIREGAIAPDLANCPSPRLAETQNIAALHDPIEMGARATAFVRFWVARSRDMQSFEIRYSNDVELLMFAALICDGLGDPRASCLPALTRAMPPEFLADSPVFCDFAEPGMRDPEAFGLAPATGIIAELPGTCGALLNDADKDIEAATRIWMERLERHLFPAPAHLINGE